jgi:hypothetical protein
VGCRIYLHWKHFCVFILFLPFCTLGAGFLCFAIIHTLPDYFKWTLFVSTDSIPYMHWWPVLNETQNMSDLPSDAPVLIWREYSRILALAKCAHISLDSVASLVGYYVDYSLFFFVIKHVYYGEYLFSLVTHCPVFDLHSAAQKF